MNNQVSEYLSQRDTRLKKVIEVSKGLALETTGDVYFDLISCIISQQIHYRRSSPAFHNFLGLFPGEYPHAGHLLNLEEQAVLDLKISGSKYQTLRRIAEWWQSENMESFPWHQHDDQALREKLCAIKGIGPWTADMILLFTLQRNDIFPLQDYGLHKALCRLYQKSVIDPKQMQEISEVWAPYRSWACRYLWQWN